MKPLMVATLAVLIASVAGQALGAAQGSRGMSVFAAAAFVGALLRVTWQINKPWWPTSGHASDALAPSSLNSQPFMASRNAMMLALGYGWGGVSLLSDYLLTPLRWQHGWQYGLGMCAIAIGLWLLSRRLAARPWTARTLMQLTWLTLSHAFAAVLALAWLVISGKLSSVKGDWAANIVFFSGALIICGISVLAIRTARTMSKSNI